MADFDENDHCIRHARRLIESGRCVLDGDWASARPTPEQQDAFLEDHGWEEFSAWHLGLDGDAGYEDKARYGFPVGDFTRVHRSALIAAMLEASRDGHRAVEREAGDLLRRLAELNP
jgi:hypothetical protein